MAKAEISKRVEDILRKYMIDAHQSELISNSRILLLNVPPKISSAMPTMSRLGYCDDPLESWVLIIHYHVTYIMNRTARSVLNIAHLMRSYMDKRPTSVS